MENLWNWHLAKLEEDRLQWRHRVSRKVIKIDQMGQAVWANRQWIDERVVPHFVGSRINNQEISNPQFTETREKIISIGYQLSLQRIIVKDSWFKSITGLLTEDCEENPIASGNLFTWQIISNVWPGLLKNKLASCCQNNCYTCRFVFSIRQK